MMDGKLSCEIWADQIPVIELALSYAEEFFITAAAQKNRNHVADAVGFEDISFAMEEVLFDPQTSGGLLLAAAAWWSGERYLPAAAVGRILPRREIEILVKNHD